MSKRKSIKRIVSLFLIFALLLNIGIDKIVHYSIISPSKSTFISSISVKSKSFPAPNKLK